MASQSLFYEGSIPEVIHKSKQEKKLLVVFLKGSNESSSLMEETLVAHGTPLLQDCFVLRIEDDLECTDVSQYKTARMFRQCFPAKTLPTVMLMGVNGQPVVTVSGPTTKEGLLEKIEEGKIAFAAQVREIDVQNQANVLAAMSTPGTIPNPSSASRPTPQVNDGARQNTTRPHPSQSVPQQEPRKQRKNIDDEEEEASLSSSMEGTSYSRPSPKQKKVEKPAEIPLPVYNTTTLQFRLTNGESIRADFASEATIREVCSYLDIHRTDGCVPYVLETLYPRQKFSGEDYGKTLKDLDLVPRSSVMLTALGSSASPVPKEAHAQNTGIGAIAGGILGGVGKAISFVNPLTYLMGGSSSGEANNNEQGAEGVQSGQEPNVGGQRIPESSDSTRVRHRAGWGGNVHGLNDSSANNEDDPSKSAFWNGNSTQFGGHED